jgi:hypothetical protein
MGGMVRRFLPDGDLDLAVLGNLEVTDEAGATTLGYPEGITGLSPGFQPRVSIKQCPALKGRHIVISALLNLDANFKLTVCRPFRAGFILGLKSQADSFAPSGRDWSDFRLCCLMQSRFSAARAFLEEVKTGSLDANRQLHWLKTETVR